MTFFFVRGDDDDDEKKKPYFGFSGFFRAIDEYLGTKRVIDASDLELIEE